MAREPVLFSVEVTIPMCTPDMISAYSICRSSTQTSPDAFGRNGCGAPPRTGTCHESQLNPSVRAV